MGASGTAAREARAGRWHIDIDRETCVSCAGCVSICPTQALDMHGLELRSDDPLCVGCDLCVRFCPVEALALEPAADVTPEDRAAVRAERDT